MAQLVVQEFPQFAGLVEIWMTQGGIRTRSKWENSYGEAMSLWTDLVERVLDLTSDHPAYVDTVEALPPRFKDIRIGRDSLQVKDAFIIPWLIVDFPELQRLSNVVRPDSKLAPCHEITHYTYSAVAIALTFLASCTKRFRTSVRNIKLYEDKVSVALPESHGRGFIPLCQENTALRVERHVSLWRTVFSVSDSTRWEYSYHSEGSQPTSRLEHDRLLAEDVTRSVGKWISEAMALPSLGMPTGSFTLVLNGEPTPEHTSEVFRIVQRDATYQAALDACYTNGTLPTPSWLGRRSHPGFVYQDFSEALRTISMKGNSLIRCNFDPGSPCDIEDMLEKHRGWSLEDWKSNWSKHEPSKFQTEPPLPPWHILRWQHVMPWASTTTYSLDLVVDVNDSIANKLRRNKARFYPPHRFATDARYW
jgi:hypothetical protein